MGTEKICAHCSEEVIYDNLEDNSVYNSVPWHKFTDEIKNELKYHSGEDAVFYTAEDVLPEGLGPAVGDLKKEGIPYSGLYDIDTFYHAHIGQLCATCFSHLLISEAQIPNKQIAQYNIF